MTASPTWKSAPRPSCEPRPGSNSSGSPRPVTVDHVGHNAHGLIIHPGHGMAVKVECDGDGGVTEVGLGDLRMDVAL